MEAAMEGPKVAFSLYRVNGIVLRPSKPTAG